MEKITQEIIDRLIWYDVGDGIEHEIWQDPETEKLWTVPIEIKRYFNNAEEN
jgi:hypothetical protein